jgi:hypothetical protein
MEVTINIEKVHTKKYVGIVVSIDKQDVKKWAIEKYGDQSYTVEEHEELTLDDEGNEVPRLTPSDDWFLDYYLDEYLEEQDADRLLNDNCHDFSNYETTDEEYSIVGFEGDL